ncbi:MAG: Retron-type RNA-directed polymerase, partial [Acidimicrobiaceae bacterium]|nr:Retron-type RNA-directed polymerase [Acidimicrobiaceae bacterium]
MTRRGQQAVGQRRVWVRDLALVALHGYPTAPRDRPRELAEFLSFCSPLLEAFDRAYARGESVPRVERWFVATTAMRERPFDVVPLNTVSDLRALLGLSVTDLEWFADVRSLERRSNEEPLRHYRYRWSLKRTGGVRLIEEPKAQLKHFQRVLSREIISRIPVHDAAHGFRPGHSAVTYAAPHAGRALVIHLDLEDFFPSIAPGRVFGIFRCCGYPESVAHMLTGLVTSATPIKVLSTAPRPRSADLLPAFRRLGRYLVRPHLPQGAPSSPAIANLVAFTLDRRLSGLADSLGLHNSRYADDLAFSSTAHSSRREEAHILDMVGTITAKEGLRI